ncbi:aminoglycoside 6-adenylyltransferase [Providencia sp. NPDC089923]|uniref:aminoglycoside 6-adenylyltransferase n=1 Tax=Providencia sp. NPDC089923 TaxID=3415004 RepID=UPI003C2C0884
MQNVAKGIWRDELPYSKQMFEYVIRQELDKMVSWWIGSKHDFQLSVGKMGKYFKRYLTESYWKMYEKTYSDHEYDNFWNSIFVTCELFKSLAEDVAKNLGFTYPIDEDSNMRNYLKNVRNLPSDAQEII